MKDLKKVALLVLAVILTNTSIVTANDAVGSDITVSVKKIKSEQKKAMIRVTNLPSDKSAVLRIKDKHGYVLHRDVINPRMAYAAKYDFSQLPDGEYLVEVKTSEGVISETFALEAGKTNPMYFKPAVQIEPGFIKVAFINRIDTPVSLKLFNEKGEVLYQERVSSQAEYAKALNVSRLSAGQYSLALLGDNYTYSRSIEVK